MEWPKGYTATEKQVARLCCNAMEFFHSNNFADSPEGGVTAEELRDGMLYGIAQKIEDLTEVRFTSDDLISVICRSTLSDRTWLEDCVLKG